MEYADEPRLIFSPVTDNDYCDFYCLEMQDYITDVPFYKSLLQPGDRILELGCGNGRLAQRLAPFCAQITGIDISDRMIQKAISAKLKANGPANIVYKQKDMLDFLFPSTFDVIIIAYNTLNLLGEEGKVRKCLQLCRDHLKGNGRLGLQLFHPDASVLATNESQKIFQFIIMEDGSGGKVIKETLKSYHAPSSTLELEERYRVRPASGKGPNRDLSHTYILYAPELSIWKSLLLTCGFKTMECSCSISGEAFRSDSDTTLYIKASVT
ncbi:MAG: class I SAM-dependent methyltransferase [Desulfocapsaceae bacterium]|nr:class I SAM-dependent methyltransferase [Desulfocapsaceae bacterium]